MRSWLLTFLGICLTAGALGAEPSGSAVPAVQAAPGEAKPLRVHVIPVRDQIGPAVLYVVRRGLKEAVAKNADAIILDMKTPGGALDTTFEIMEVLAKFPGTTVTYVNTEAISAGAFIAATTEEIWFAPDGIIGAAAPVSGDGKDIDVTMKQKVVSYLKARIRAMSEARGGYRGQVVSAMVDAEYELKIEDKVLKGKGELLSLTATEALKFYGDPARPLLATGIAKSVDELIAKRFGPGRATVVTLKMTWSETLAVWLNAASPILLGLGMLALFIEFKTPGFGMFGIIGIVTLALVFLGNYVAGFSGHEPILFFLLGLVLIAVEIFFMPGAVIMALSGLALMLGSLVWSMADLWPNQPLAIAWSGDAFVGPLINLSFGLLIAVGLGIGLARFLPRGWVWDKLVVQATVGGAAQVAGGEAAAAMGIAALVGREGVATTALRPEGQVEIAGQIYDARVEVGAVERGRPVVVRGHTDFALIVEEKS